MEEKTTYKFFVDDNFLGIVNDEKIVKVILKEFDLPYVKTFDGGTKCWSIKMTTNKKLIEDVIDFIEAHDLDNGQKFVLYNKLSDFCLQQIAQLTDEVVG